MPEPASLAAARQPCQPVSDFSPLPVQVFLVAVGANNVTVSQVSLLQGVVTPDTQAPSFTGVSLGAVSINQTSGNFSLSFAVNTSEPATVHYAIYRWAAALPAGVGSAPETQRPDMDDTVDLQ